LRRVGEYEPQFCQVALRLTARSALEVGNRDTGRGRRLLLGRREQHERGDGIADTEGHQQRRDHPRPDAATAPAVRAAVAPARLLLAFRCPSLPPSYGIPEHHTLRRRTANAPSTPRVHGRTTRQPRPSRTDSCTSSIGSSTKSACRARNASTCSSFSSASI